MERHIERPFLAAYTIRNRREPVRVAPHAPQPQHESGMGRCGAATTGFAGSSSGELALSVYVLVHRRLYIPTAWHNLTAQPQVYDLVYLE